MLEHALTSVDLAARQCVMASMLYYGLDTPMMTDAEYDKLAEQCADEWKRLTPFRKWQLGGKPEIIRTSGFLLRVTVLTADACVGWLDRNNMLRGPVTISRRWRIGHNVRWLHPGDFKWA